MINIFILVYGPQVLWRPKEPPLPVPFQNSQVVSSSGERYEIHNTLDRSPLNCAKSQFF